MSQTSPAQRRADRRPLSLATAGVAATALVAASLLATTPAQADRPGGGALSDARAPDFPPQSRKVRACAPEQIRCEGEGPGMRAGMVGVGERGCPTPRDPPIWPR